MQLVVNASGTASTFTLNPNSVSGSGVGTYNGSATGGTSTWNSNYNFTAASSADSASKSGTLSISNLSGAERTYSVRLTLPTASAATLAGLFNGSLSGTIMTTGAGYFRSVTGVPLWSATTDSVTVASLFTAPVNIVRTTTGVSSLGSQSFGGSSPSVPASLFGTNVAINLNFILSANASVTFNTTLNGVSAQVPTPSALALLGLAGACGARRRRR